jgi:hypothetical protein
MKSCGGSRGIAPTFLTSALYGGEWPASRHIRFTPRYPLHMRLGGIPNRSERCGEQKISFSCQGLNSERPARRQMGYPGLVCVQNLVFTVCKKSFMSYIYGLYNHAFSSWDYEVSSRSINNEWRIQKDMEGSECCIFQSTTPAFA